MAEIKWIKLSVNMFNDEKIKLIRTMPEGDSIALIWIQILCLAGKINDGGLVYMGQNLAYSDEMLATILDHPLNTMRVALSTFEQFGMIDMNNQGEIDIINWEKHQSTDKMARIQKQNRDRKRKYDLRKKLLSLGYDPNNADVPTNLEDLEEYVSNVTETLSNATEVRSKKLDVRSKKLEVNNIEQNHLDNKLSESQLKTDFEALWKLYPNKKGKAKAKKAYIKAIKDGVTNKEIQDGIVAYTKEIKAKNTDKEYIKHGSTWFNNRAWEDEYDTTPTQPKRYGQSNYQEPVPEFMQEKAIDENDIDLERDIELEERIKALSDRNNKNDDSP